MRVIVSSASSIHYKLHIGHYIRLVRIVMRYEDIGLNEITGSPKKNTRKNYYFIRTKEKN